MEHPEGKMEVHLFDGAIGRTRLAGAYAEAELSDHQRLEYRLYLQPQLRQQGNVVVLGSMPLSATGISEVQVWSWYLSGHHH